MFELTDILNQLKTAHKMAEIVSCAEMKLNNYQVALDWNKVSQEILSTINKIEDNL